MKYILLPLFLLIYSELLGQAFSDFIGIKKLKFSFPLGFSLILAVSYVLFFIPVAANMSYWVIFVETAIIFITGSILIYKYHQNITFKLDLNFFLFFIFFGIEIFFFLKRSHGDLYGLDTLTYSNMIRANIKAPVLQIMEYDSGYIRDTINSQYAFQSYYLLFSCLLYPIRTFFHFLNIPFFYFSSYIFCGSLVFFALEASVIFSSFDLLNIKNKLFKAFIIIFWLGFYGLRYWNTSLAYVGNVYRIVICSYLLISIYKFFKENNKKYLIIYIIYSLAISSLASCNALIPLLLSFVMIIVSISKDINVLKEMVLAIYLPFINLVFWLLGAQNIVFISLIIVVMTIISLLIYKFNSFIFEIIKKYKLHIVLAVTATLALTAASYFITGNIFDISAFTDTLSYSADMSNNYTYTDYPYIIPNIVFWMMLISGFILMLKNKSEVISITAGVAIIFFLPSASALWQTINPVYYRNYDIFINAFIFILIFKELFILLNKKSYYLLSVLIPLSLLSAVIMYPSMVDKLPEDFNYLERMSNSEAEVINFLNDYVLEHDLTDAKTITYIPQIKSEFPTLKPLIGRAYIANHDEGILGELFDPTPWIQKLTSVDEEAAVDDLIKYQYRLGVIRKDIFTYFQKHENYYPLEFIFRYADFTCIYENADFMVYVKN